MRAPLEQISQKLTKSSTSAARFRVECRESPQNVITLQCLSDKLPFNQINPAFCAGESLVGESESTAGMLQGLFLSQSDSIFSLASERESQALSLSHALQGVTLVLF